MIATGIGVIEIWHHSQGVKVLPGSVHAIPVSLSDTYYCTAMGMHGLFLLCLCPLPLGMHVARPGGWSK